MNTGHPCHQLILKETHLWGSISSSFMLLATLEILCPMMEFLNSHQAAGIHEEKAWSVTRLHLESCGKLRGW